MLNIYMPAIYEYHNVLYFYGYKTDKMIYIVELYNPTKEDYCCKGTGIRHPAAGKLVRKTSVRRLKPEEITDEMRKQLTTRIKQSRKYIM
jgi:hypothetical protein